MKIPKSRLIYISVSVLLLVLIIFASYVWISIRDLPYPLTYDKTPGILRILPGAVNVELIDEETGHLIINKDVIVYSDNGITCAQSDCPSNSREYRGKTDATGIINIPSGYTQAISTFIMQGYKPKGVENIYEQSNHKLNLEKE